MVRCPGQRGMQATCCGEADADDACFTWEMEPQPPPPPPPPVPPVPPTAPVTVSTVFQLLPLPYSAGTGPSVPRKKTPLAPLLVAALNAEPGVALTDRVVAVRSFVDQPP